MSWNFRIATMNINGKARDWLVVIPVGCLFFVLWPFIGNSKAFLTACIVYVFYAIVSAMWDNRREPWFWIILGLFFLAHLAMIYIIKVPADIRPSLIVLPFALVDGLMMYGVLTLWDRRKGRRD